MKHPLPTFVIDFAGPEWPWITFNSYDGKFISGERFTPNVESIHFVSEKDPLYPYLKNNKNFENGLVIEFD